MRRLPADRLPFLLLLAGCLFAYVAFHAVRHRLPAGALHDSFPSLLAPLAMFAVVELTPGVRFHGLRIKLAVFTATLLVAVVWLEAIAPRLTRRATGDPRDAAAMAAGFALFCLYDAAFGRKP